ncbi:response regulator [Litorimonas sp.]|jgi:DNA-binding response OmpR family regulator|uniref:response regulator n=1 Tax=Litorimonas sp. TaxID=1892381 RepID=UPI003A8ABE79
MNKQTEHKSILIVEDDPFIAMDLEDTFTDAGFTVIGPVADVKSGLTLIKRQRPDIATLDYNLGRENSVPIANALEDLSVPYIFLSGQMRRVIENHDIPAQSIVGKPYVPSKLLKIIRYMIDKAAPSSGLAFG